MRARLNELRKLTQLALDVEMMKLNHITAAEREKRDQMMALDVSGAKRAALLTELDGFDLALRAGVDMRWDKWRQKEKLTLNTQRAALLAEHDIQRLATQIAFGKNEAVRRLEEKEAENEAVIGRRV